ncbi:hypothetical protein Lal_00007468 [Lupinus albus]|nr:hypothetical protein Lal_00007468 [Lupinus albus]
MGCKDMSKLKWRRREKREKGGRALQKKMKKLQRLIPDGGRLKPDQLFVRTAEHILQLRLQLNVLQTLFKMFIKP